MSWKKYKMEMKLERLIYKRQTIKTKPMEMIKIGLELMKKMDGDTWTDVVIVNRTTESHKSDKWFFDRLK